MGEVDFLYANYWLAQLLEMIFVQTFI